MLPLRSVIALDPRLFGRGPHYDLDTGQRVPRSDEWSEDFKLFAGTFVGGFLFMAIYLA